MFWNVQCNETLLSSLKTKKLVTAKTTWCIFLDNAMGIGTQSETWSDKRLRQGEFGKLERRKFRNHTFWKGRFIKTRIVKNNWESLFYLLIYSILCIKPSIGLIVIDFSFIRYSLFWSPLSLKNCLKQWLSLIGPNARSVQNLLDQIYTKPVCLASNGIKTKWPQKWGFLNWGWILIYIHLFYDNSLTFWCSTWHCCWCPDSRIERGLGFDSRDCLRWLICYPNTAG